MAIQKHYMEINQILSLVDLIEEGIHSHIDKVKFVLFMAKDCFHLNNDETKPLAQSCITLVESWVANPNSVTKQQLKDTVNNYYNVNYNPYSVYYAFSAARLAIYICADLSYDSFSIYDAYHALFHANRDNEIQKFPKYQNYAYSLLRTTDIIPRNIKGKITDKATLMALLDELHEQGEDLILHANNLFTLNHPDYLATNTLPELVDLIWSNQSLLHYLEHLYDQVC